MKNSNNYYYDCEFLEGTQTIYQYGIKTDYILRFFAILLAIYCFISFMVVGDNLIGLLCIVPALVLYNLSMESTPNTIDLISIGFVSGDDREYYAISKEFNLKEAWNRFDEKVEIMSGDMRNRFPNGRKYKDYWIRENVLKPIFLELVEIELKDYNSPYYKALYTTKEDRYMFSYKRLKQLINKYGKTNKQIADEVKTFLYNGYEMNTFHQDIKNNPIKLFGYYSAFDHVCLAWLYGKMINLPSHFPMYTRDLKQMLDEKINSISSDKLSTIFYPSCSHNVFEYLDKSGSLDKVKKIKDHPNYPKETNSHNALSDAIFNKQLHEFIQSL